MSTPEEIEFEAWFDEATDHIEAELREDEEFARWLEEGMRRRWIAAPDCSTHNGIPMREGEEQDFDDGGDPCIIVARVWRDGYGPPPA